MKTSSYVVEFTIDNEKNMERFASFEDAIHFVKILDNNTPFMFFNLISLP